MWGALWLLALIHWSLTSEKKNAAFPMVSSYVRMIEGPGGSCECVWLNVQRLLESCMCHRTIKTGKSMGILIYSCVPDRLSVWLLNISNHEGAIRMLDILKIALRFVLIILAKSLFLMDYERCWVRWLTWPVKRFLWGGDWVWMWNEGWSHLPQICGNTFSFSLLSVFCSLLSFRDRKYVIVFPSPHF